MQRLERTDLEKGLIRLSCKSGQIAFSGVTGSFVNECISNASLVTPIKFDGLDQLLVVVNDPSSHNLIVLQTQFNV